MEWIASAAWILLTIAVVLAMKRVKTSGRRSSLINSLLSHKPRRW